jgi:hypothetical protein
MTPPVLFTGLRRLLDPVDVGLASNERTGAEADEDYPLILAVLLPPFGKAMVDENPQIVRDFDGPDVRQQARVVDRCEDVRIREFGLDHLPQVREVIRGRPVTVNQDDE